MILHPCGIVDSTLVLSKPSFEIKTVEKNLCLYIRSTWRDCSWYHCFDSLSFLYIVCHELVVKAGYNGSQTDLPFFLLTHSLCPFDVQVWNLGARIPFSPFDLTLKWHHVIRFQRINKVERMALTSIKAHDCILLFFLLSFWIIAFHRSKRDPLWWTSRLVAVTSVCWTERGCIIEEGWQASSGNCRNSFRRT